MTAGLLIALNTGHDVCFLFVSVFFLYFGKFQTYAKIEINEKCTLLIIVINVLYQLLKFINCVLSFCPYHPLLWNILK